MHGTLQNQFGYPRKEGGHGQKDLCHLPLAGAIGDLAAAIPLRAVDDLLDEGLVAHNLDVGRVPGMVRVDGDGGADPVPLLQRARDVVQGVDKRDDKEAAVLADEQCTACAKI